MEPIEILSQSTTLRQAGRRLAKSLGLLIVNLLLLSAIVEGLGIEPAVAPIATMLVLGTVGYPIDDQWTFREFDGPTTLLDHLKTFVAYMTSHASSWVVKYIVYVSILWLLPYLVAWIIAAGTGFLLSFFLSRSIWRGIS